MTSVSAPGKVLLAGGYLVVDRAYQGLVLGLSARIHAVVQKWDDKGKVIVRSPQFLDASWCYECHYQPTKGIEVIQVER